MKEPPIEPTTRDAFLGGRLMIEQPAKGFRGGLDAVLLAAAVEAGSNEAPAVLDVGAGVGTAGLALAVRIQGAHVTLIEIAPSLAGLARRNIERNGLGDRARVVECDVLASAAVHEAAGLSAGAFDVVVANPPHLDEERHRLPVDRTAATAFGMASGHLARWARFMARMASSGGRMALIHRAEALADVLAAIEGRFGAVRVVPVYPRVGAPAHRIVVLARKGSRAPLQLLPGLVLHGDGNAFLPPVQSVLRDGAALALAGSRH